MSSAKMPSASVTANPKIRRPNWPFDGRRVAQRAVQEVAEQRADADRRRAGAHGREAGADELGCLRIHLFKLLGVDARVFSFACVWDRKAPLGQWTGCSASLRYMQVSIAKT